MKRRALLATVLVAAACSGSTNSADVRPFSDIALTEPQIVFDPSGTAATLTVATAIDAVCAVSYGIGSPSGAIATDQDMGGGAGHDDHSALMTGLMPETEYQYRLQGVDADGSLYRSEIMTFTTPAAAEGTGTNVAIGATVVEVSSEFSSRFAAELAIDGDLATEWSSRGDGDDAFITIDLGTEVDATAVAFRTRSMSDGSATTETYTVDVDGVVFGPFRAGSDPAPVTFRAREVTFRVESSTGGNTGAAEVEVYAG